MQLRWAFETLGALLGLSLVKFIFFLNLGLLAHWGWGGGGVCKGGFKKIPHTGDTDSLDECG